jgi:hypothetical protein
MKIVGCDFRPGGTRPKPSAVVRRPSLPSSSWTFKAVGEVLDSRGRKALIPAFFVALPAILFYAILFRKAINVPFMDDYEALLDFLNRMTELQSGSAKASYFLASQFNEYKLFFAHGVAWLQLALCGHVYIKLLCAVGNGFVLLLAVLLWKMFLPDYKNLTHRLAFFIPVSWLLFQLQYAQTLNWAMPSLQNLPVLFFSLGAIYLLVRPGQGPFCGSLVCFVLAVASSGNGFLLIPIGVLILVSAHRYVHVVCWLAISAGCIAAYAYRYNVLSSQSRLQHSVFSTVIRPRPLYVIAFIGNAAAFPGRFHVILGLFVGLLLCVFFFVIARRGYVRKNPLVSYCILFLLLTAVGVAGLRSDLGLAQSLDSRYGIYSALFLIFAWFAIVEEFVQHEDVPLLHNHNLLVAIAGAVLFALSMDGVGWLNLESRNRWIIVGMAAFEHPVSRESSIGPILPYPNQNARLDELDRRAPAILRQSTKLGIYKPPAY